MLTSEKRTRLARGMKTRTRVGVGAAVAAAVVTAIMTAPAQAVAADQPSLAVSPNCYAVIGNPYPWDEERVGTNSAANCNGASNVRIVTYLYHLDWHCKCWRHGGSNSGRPVYLGYVNGSRSSYAWDWAYFCSWRSEARVYWTVGGVDYMHNDWSPVINVCG
jgi:hypothetical protein